MKSGDKPIFLALGAMSFEDKAEVHKSDMLIKPGVASDEIDGHNITGDKIISCIKDMELHYEERYQKVKQLSEKIRNEKGLEVAVRYISEII